MDAPPTKPNNLVIGPEPLKCRKERGRYRSGRVTFALRSSASHLTLTKQRKSTRKLDFSPTALMAGRSPPPHWLADKHFSWTQVAAAIFTPLLTPTHGDTLRYDLTVTVWC
ncbi:hypothetical protein ZHAS_00004251 [Anopheles sinensis]|uniref:Uncharacterized protein n=1 Tax=Anopheles sinensis TaxID=74873 RepID=A0A084VGG1_ANOSI|nr:hypothetical protein ZHAS_00004251 [Anopheles sinensis]